MRARYDEELLGVDRKIGELVAELRRRGAYDDTLILLTGDHGEEFGEHGGAFHGQSLYDELLHVPLVWKPPAAWEAPAGQVVDGLTEQRNVGATFLDAARAGGPPAGTRSLVPWLHGARHDVPNRVTVSEGTDQIAVHAERWKMIVGKSGGGYELYDLRRDPGEQRNLASDDRPRLALMRRLLAAWKDHLRPAPHKQVTMDSETREGLANLGYVGQRRGSPAATPSPGVTPSPAATPVPH
jgi:arylsulfatase A-like enzyme